MGGSEVLNCGCVISMDFRWLCPTCSRKALSAHPMSPVRKAAEVFLAMSDDERGAMLELIKAGMDGAGKLADDTPTSAREDLGAATWPGKGQPDWACLVI